MRRREFVTLVGGAAAWPLPAHAKIPVVAFLSGVAVPAQLVDAFRQGLGQRSGAAREAVPVVSLPTQRHTKDSSRTSQGEKFGLKQNTVSNY
jgi:hypothetical protein